MKIKSLCKGDKNMKKTSDSRFVRLFKRIFNLKSWSDWERVKYFFLYILDSIKQLFILQPVTKRKQETFAKAAARLNLTENNLLERQRSLFRLSMIMVGMAVLLLIYAGYELYHGAILSFILSLVVTCIALILAFRYHFWYFQIKERKLGCTIKEWWHQSVNNSTSIHKGGQ